MQKVISVIFAIKFTPIRWTIRTIRSGFNVINAKNGYFGRG